MNDPAARTEKKERETVNIYAMSTISPSIYKVPNKTSAVLVSISTSVKRPPL